jgi:nicotinate phosphoribosyltransferase
LQEYAGLPRRKRSTGKATWPGRKQVWRRYDRYGRMMADVLSVEGDLHEGEPLIHPMMAGGRRSGPRSTLHDIRAHARHELERLPTDLTAIRLLVPYPVHVSASLEQLAAVADWRMSLSEVRA